MSCLDSFIRRLEAQRACLDLAAASDRRSAGAGARARLGQRSHLRPSARASAGAGDLRLRAGGPRPSGRSAGSGTICCSAIFTIPCRAPATACRARRRWRMPTSAAAIARPPPSLPAGCPARCRPCSPTAPGWSLTSPCSIVPWCRSTCPRGSPPTAISSTAIDPNEGAARDPSLRMVSKSCRRLEFLFGARMRRLDGAG